MAIMPVGPREKRQLCDLGVARGRGDYLKSGDLLLFARGVGHTLQKLLNSGVRAAFKKTATPVTFPPLACFIQAPNNFLHAATSRSK